MTLSENWSFENLRPVLDTVFFFEWEQSSHSLAVRDSDLKDLNAANGCKMLVTWLYWLACGPGHHLQPNRSSDSRHRAKSVDHWLPDCKVNDFCKNSSRNSKHIKEFIINPTTVLFRTNCFNLTAKFHKKSQSKGLIAG